MGVERIDGSHPLRSQFTTFQKQHPSKAIIQEFRPSPPLSPLATATTAAAAAMVHITSMTTITPRRRGGVLSLKDIMQRPSLSPSSTAATDVIYKTNTNGLWLEFPVAARRSNTSATTADRNAIMEESRDEPEIRHSSSIATEHEEETRFLSNHLMEHPPQLFSLGARFHARTEGYLVDEIPIMDYMELHMEVPKIVSFDHNAVAVALADAVMVANSDDSLFTNDEENNDDNDDDSDGWSFDTDPDASFESFEEISILTQETLDLEDIKMNETPVPTDTATVQEKKTSLDDFEEIKMNSFQMAIQDAALTNFLVDFCSPVVSSFKG